MWLALIVACGTPEEGNPVLESTFALSWGAANRSEGGLITERPEGGWYVVIDIASPARTDPRLIAVDASGEVQWEEQWGRPGDDEVGALVPLSSGLLAAGGRQRLQPTEDSDSVANLTLIDPAGPEIVDPMFYEWNASSEADRISGISEVEDGTLAMVGEAGPQLLFAEVDVEGETLFQQRTGPEELDIAGTVALGDGDFVVFGTSLDPQDFNDEGQLYAAQVTRGGTVVRDVGVGDLYQVREVGTDLVIVDDDWLFVGETGDAADADVRIASFRRGIDLLFDVTWDSGGPDRDPRLFVAPDGTVWGAVVRNRDELVPFTLDPSDGTVSRLTGLVGVDAVRDLWVDDERFCVSAALPGDVKGGYFAAFVCGAFDGDEIVWPALREEASAEGEDA